MLSCDDEDSQDNVPDLGFGIEVTGAEGQNSLASNGTLQLTALFSSDNVSDEVRWSSDNTEVAEVDETTGLVTGKQAGTVTITATSQENSNITASVDLTVALAVTSIAITIADEVDIRNGDCTVDCENLETVTVERALPHLTTNPSRLLKVTVLPQEAPNKGIDLAFDEGTDGDANFEIVGTDETTGEITLKVTGITAGEATLRATAQDGFGATDEITVKVTQDHYVVTLDLGNYSSFTIVPLTDNNYGATTGKLAYDYNVDLNNDGIFDETGLTRFTTLNFGTGGVHTIRISGKYPNPTLDEDDPENTTIRSVDQWGTQEWISMAAAFRGCPNLEIPATDVPNLSKVLNMEQMFDKATSANPDVSRWNTSNVEIMAFMFKGATSANPDVSGWNTSNVEIMAFMFKGATSATPDVSGWNTEKVTDMSGMFNGAFFANPDVSGWDISSIDNNVIIQPMKDMFKCSAISVENYEGALNNFAEQADGNDNLQGIDLGAVQIVTEDATALSSKAFLTDPNGAAWTIDDGNAEFCE